MCFRTKEYYERAIPAATNITAFKVLSVNSSRKIYSPIQFGVEWKHGSVKIAPNFKSQATYRSISHGIHCFKSITDAWEMFDDSKAGQGARKVFLVTIPMGTLMYENGTQYCAERVILERYNPIKVTTIVKKAKKKVVKKTAKKATVKRTVKKKK